MPGRDIRILLVDDEETLIEYLSKRLLQEGFTVRATTSGDDAVEVARGEDFDVAVVDLKMPGMDGIEVQRALKEIRPFLQTVVLTGHGSLDTALESGRQEAFRYLVKPADHEVLVKTIREAAEHKFSIQHDRFRTEMEEIATSGGSPRAIMRAIEDLRKKYDIQ
jgi:two-component system NtrC family response regulator